MVTLTTCDVSPDTETRSRTYEDGTADDESDKMSFTARPRSRTE
jgi:hypothetical protein